MKKFSLFAVSLIIVLTIPAVFPIHVTKTVYFHESNLIAAGPTDDDPLNTTTDTGNDTPVITPAVNNSNPVKSNPSASTPNPGAVNSGTRPTVSPPVITGNTVVNSETLHNNRGPSKNNSPFKQWLNQMNLRDTLNLKDRFWAGIPVVIGFFGLFIGLALFFYLVKLKNLRQPLLLLSIIFFGFYLGGVPNPINAIFDFLSNHLVWVSLILILLPVILSLFWGRFYCGWICPLGGVQEFLHPDPERRSLPQPLDRVLKYLKLMVLIVVGYLSWHSHSNSWQNFDLTKTLFTFSGSLAAIIILASIILISILVSRPFCKYLCPLGAILALTSRLAPFRMRADAKTCMVCGKCRQGQCPMDAISAFNPEIDLPDIDNTECIKCSRCQKNCRNSALRVTGFKIDHVYSDVKKQTGNYD